MDWIMKDSKRLLIYNAIDTILIPILCGGLILTGIYFMPKFGKAVVFLLLPAVALFLFSAAKSILLILKRESSWTSRILALTGLLIWSLYFFLAISHSS